MVALRAEKVEKGRREKRAMERVKWKEEKGEMREGKEE